MTAKPLREEVMSETPAPQCGECGFRWTSGFDAALETVTGAADRYRNAFGRLDHSARSGADDVWSPPEYLWHVVDVLRYGTERLWTLRFDSDAGIMPWDEKLVAAVRARSPLSVRVGLHALAVAAGGWITAATEAPAEVTTFHPDFGSMDRTAMVRRNAHEVVHHELDIRRNLANEDRFRA